MFLPLLLSRRTNLSLVAAEGPSLLPIVLASLVGLLKPSIESNPVGVVATGGPLHEVALQVLLKLATSTADFKSHVASLSLAERQRFELSARQSVEQAQQAAVRETRNPFSAIPRGQHGSSDSNSNIGTGTTSKQLKLDFSKYEQLNGNA